MRAILWRASAVGAFCAACSVARAENNVNVTFEPWNNPDAVQVVNDPDRGYVMQMTSQGPPADPSNPSTIEAASAYWTPDHYTTLGDITDLSFDYKGTAGIVTGGSPRFYLGLDLNGNGVYDSYYDPTTDQWVQSDGNLFIYAAGLNNPWPSGWTSTGNVIGSSQPMYDTGQVGGNDWGSTYADALDTVWYGPGPNYGKEIKDIQVLQIGVAVDGGWDSDTDYLQQMLIDGITYQGVMPGPDGAAFSEFLTVPVPEPSTLMMLSLGALMGLSLTAARGRRRLRHSEQAAEASTSA